MGTVSQIWWARLVIFLLISRTSFYHVFLYVLICFGLAESIVGILFMLLVRGYGEAASTMRRHFQRNIPFDTQKGLMKPGPHMHCLSSSLKLMPKRRPVSLLCRPTIHGPVAHNHGSQCRVQERFPHDHFGNRSAIFRTCEIGGSHVPETYLPILSCPSTRVLGTSTIRFAIENFCPVVRHQLEPPL